jgi:hypothetical protein
MTRFPHHERDTAPEAHARQIAVCRTMTGERRLELALRMSDEARAITLAGIRARHADYSERDARLALFRLLLGDALFRAAWPAAPLLLP